MLHYFLLTVLSISSLLHPIHVSVTDIEHDETRKALEITTHIFIDDIEKDIRQILKEPYLDVTKPGKGRTSDQLYKAYLKERFKLKVNGKEVDYKYLGHEREAGAIFVYLEVEKVRKLNSITVRNEVLLDLYDDQINLIHIKVKGEIRSMKLEEDHRVDNLEY